MRLLDGRVALITGASRGIGQATARCFAAAGARLVLCARGEALTALEAELVATGVEVVARRGDVTDESFLKELVMAGRRHFGSLDILVNNAGVLRLGLVGMTSGAQLDELFEVNIKAQIRLTGYVARAMRRERGPAIVNVASIAGTRGMEGVASYAASKAAVVGFTLAAAKELAPKGIRVNAVAPGFIDTEMTRGLARDWYERRVSAVALGRIGTPEEVADAILFLASPMARYVTGQVLGVDGGMVA